MKRLTKKVNGVYTISKDNLYYSENGFTGTVPNKLGMLEDVEDKIGISLHLLFLALENGVFGYHNKEILDLTNVPIIPALLDKGWGFYVRNGLHFEFYFKDYGKTWALSEAELKP